MKPILRTIVLLTLAMTTAAAVAKPRGVANVYMNNGTEYRDVTIKCPDGWDKKIEFTDGTTKYKIPSDSIDHLEIWHSENPENVAYIKYGQWCTYDPKKDKFDSQKDSNRKWFVLEAAGPHLSYWMSLRNVKPGKKSISMGVTGVPNALNKEGSTYMIIVDQGWRKSVTANWLKAFLADDEKLVSEITEEGYYNKQAARRQGNIYNPFIYEDLVDDYVPGRKLEK